MTKSNHTASNSFSNYNTIYSDLSQARIKFYFFVFVGQSSVNVTKYINILLKIYKICVNMKCKFDLKSKKESVLK